MDGRAFHRIHEAFYRGAFDADVVAELAVLVVPARLCADDALLTWLRAYAADGGHLVLGVRTGGTGFAGCGSRGAIGLYESR